MHKAYKKYSEGNSYTTISIEGNTDTLISMLNGNLGGSVSGFGGFSVPGEYQRSLLNEIYGIQNSGYSIGLVMIDLSTGKGLSYNPDQRLYSASSIKGLYIGSLLAQNRAAYDSDKNNMVTILRTSDNTLYENLFKKYGNSYLKNWCTQTGINPIYFEKLYANYSARDMAKLWVKMNEFFNSSSFGNEIGGWYQNPNASPIHSQLSGKYITRSKAGWIGMTGYMSAADGGIVYASNGAYVITMITNMPGTLSRLNGIVNLLDAVHNTMK